MIDAIDLDALAKHVYEDLYSDYAAMSNAFHGMGLLLESLGIDASDACQFLRRLDDAVAAIQQADDDRNLDEFAIEMEIAADDAYKAHAA